VEPLSVALCADAALIACFARDYDAAIAQCRKALELAPDFGLAHVYRGWAYLHKGIAEEALVEFAAARTFATNRAAHLPELGCAYVEARRVEEARKVLAEVLENSKRCYLSAYHIALLCTALGEHDQAFQWFEQACADHNPWMVYLRVEPRLDALRPDVRFHSLLRRLGLAA
jgi:tetratricopeptide (TPR) repeat protein